MGWSISQDSLIPLLCALKRSKQMPQTLNVSSLSSEVFEILHFTTSHHTVLIVASKTIQQLFSQFVQLYMSVSNLTMTCSLLRWCFVVLFFLGEERGSLIAYTPPFFHTKKQVYVKCNFLYIVCAHFWLPSILPFPGLNHLVRLWKDKLHDDEHPA